MNLKPYPEYKEGELPWIGRLPGHWNVLPLKRDLAFLTSGSRGWADHYADDGALFLRIGNLTRDQIVIDLDDIQRVAVPEGTEGERTRVQAGDLLFSITAFLGSVAVVPEELETSYVSQHVALARIHQRLFLPTWCAYVTLSCVGKNYLETQGYGGTKIQLSLSDVANLVLPTPPLDEQTAIAAFLDRETAKIDALVAEQEKLIELLKEKRQAVISHAVTKGLDPNAPMKDSGVEWLGEVPEHWVVVPLKWFSRCASGENISCILVEPEDNGVLFSVIGGNGVMGYGPSFNINKTLIVIGRVGALCGNVHLVKEKAWITDNALTLDASMEIFVPEFLEFILKARNLNEIASKTAQPLITGTQVRDQRIPAPSINEQTEIVDYLQQKLSTFDSLVVEAQHAIDLLKERRSALISAAVTGKIDVRGLAEAV